MKESTLFFALFLAGTLTLAAGLSRSGNRSAAIRFISYAKMDAKYGGLQSPVT